jgi:asparagine synthetase B (glutamine-hydrolysing)
MCGIVAYLGAAEAYPKLIKGLKRLEYRGYDSSGVALHNGDLLVYKKKGKVSDLEAHAAGKPLHYMIYTPPYYYIQKIVMIYFVRKMNIGFLHYFHIGQDIL